MVKVNSLVVLYDEAEAADEDSQTLTVETEEQEEDLLADRL